MSGTIRLNGSTSGYVELTAPAVAGSTSLTLPLDSLQPGMVHLHTETVSAVSSVSIDNVFSSTYENYLIVPQFTSTASAALRCRYRLSGTDASGATDYTRQRLDVDGSSVSAARTSSSFLFCGSLATTALNGSHFFVYGPFLAQPTAARSVVVGSSSGAYLNDTASTHNQSVSYDGFTLYLDTGTFTGSLRIYGYRNN